MAYDGMYADLSTRGTTNEILTEVREVQIQVNLSEDAVTTLAAQAVDSAALAEGSAATALINAGLANNASINAVAAQNAAAQAQISAEAASSSAVSKVAPFITPKASAPSTRDNGSPLQTGDRYFNTTSNSEYIYKSGAWVANDSMVAIGEIKSTTGSTYVGYTDPGVGAVPTTLDVTIKDQAVNVMRYGAAGIGGDDTLAVQRAMTYALSANKPLYFPKGSFGVTQNISASNKSLSILGEGTGLTKIWVDHNGSGLSFTSTDRTQNLNIRGLEIISTNANAVTGLEVTFPTTSAVDQSQLSLSDVVVRVSGAGTWNYAGVKLSGVKNPLLSKVVVRGNIATTLYGISLEDQTIDADLDTCRVYLVGKGINIVGANEGTVIRGYTAVSVKTGIDIAPTNSGPWISISNFHINSSEYGIKCTRRTQVEINNGLLYANDLFGSTSWTAVSFDHNVGQFAEYCNVKDVICNRQSFSGSTVGISFANSRNCQVTNCSFVNMTIPILEDSTSTGIYKAFNQYPGVTNPVTKNGALGGEPFRINTTFAQNRLLVSGALTGTTPQIEAEGIDTIINLNLNSKGGNGTVALGSTGAGVGFQVLTPASTANRARAVGGTAGNPATIDATGSDTLVWLALRGKGAAGITLPSEISLNYANDSAAATGGVPVGGVYHTSGTLKIRLS